jgi:nicotinate-nucleotide adenylyltransferase
MQQGDLTFVKKIGIFGGTFDPIHLGHLRAAVEIREGFALDAVYLIPSATPPHKTRSDISPPEDRLEMVRRGIGNTKGLRVSDIELKRQGPSYTIDTVCAFRKNLPSNVWLYLIMGLDAFLEISTWKSYEELLHLVPLIIINRPDPDGRLHTSINNAIDTLMARGELKGYTCSMDSPCYTHCEKQPIFTFNVTALDIAASRIRETIRRGGAIDFLVPPGVADFIHEKRLYQ